MGLLVPFSFGLKLGFRARFSKRNNREGEEVKEKFFFLFGFNLEAPNDNFSPAQGFLGGRIGESFVANCSCIQSI